MLTVHRVIASGSGKIAGEDCDFGAENKMSTSETMD